MALARLCLLFVAAVSWNGYGWGFQDHSMTRRFAVNVLKSSAAELDEPLSVTKRVFAKDKRPIILFDGVCNLCNNAVNLALDWDPHGNLRFSALQSNVGRSLLRANGRRADDISSIVVVTERGAYTKSDAILVISEELTPLPFFPLRPAAVLGRLIVPQFLRDLIYDGVADNRYSLMGKRNECRFDADGSPPWKLQSASAPWIWIDLAVGILCSLQKPILESTGVCMFCAFLFVDRNDCSGHHARWFFGLIGEGIFDMFAPEPLIIFVEASSITAPKVKRWKSTIVVVSVACNYLSAFSLFRQTTSHPTRERLKMVNFEQEIKSDDSDKVSTMRPKIIAAEEDSENEHDDIPGPVNPKNRVQISNHLDLSKSKQSLNDSNNCKRGNGTLASRKDLAMPADEFAEGCKLLQQAALGNEEAMDEILKKRPHFVNFRDYDRRTAMHIASSEGNLKICRYLVSKGAQINRSDRWGGSPLDDAHRHRHSSVIAYLRELGATTGSTSNKANFISAAAGGDLDEVNTLLAVGNIDIDEGDYDRRTALHLAAGEGNFNIVELLCANGANVNIEDRWGGRPLDDAERSKNAESIEILKKFGATKGTMSKADIGSSSTRREVANLEVDFNDLEMVERIGKGSFGEIYKCTWRGTLVAAKCIQSSRIRQQWIQTQAMAQIDEGGDIDEAIAAMDEATTTINEEALRDFRKEISVLKSLRHPNIVLLLAYSATENLEVMISELMKCSLLDIFKAHIVNGSKMKKQDQLVYAKHLAQGMLYLHTCRPPIIHRDLKPANLLIDHSGVLKVADFGLATVRPDPKQGVSEVFMMTGEAGSYRFMAPEVFRHENYTETVDVYSFAMILYYLLDGKPPWPYLNGLIAVRKAAHDGERPEVPRNWDQRLHDLLQECWSETPTARPPFKQVLKVINDYASTLMNRDYLTELSVLYQY
eukprot:scaffold681_cov130-Cylindrotheca_fusiformis.AAC.7